MRKNIYIAFFTFCFVFFSIHIAVAGNFPDFSNATYQQTKAAIAGMYSKPLLLGVYSKYDYNKNEGGVHSGNAQIFKEFLKEVYDIQVKIVEFKSESEVERALLAGEIDIAFGIRQRSGVSHDIYYADAMFPRIFYIISNDITSAHMRKNNIKALSGQTFIAYAYSDASDSVSNLLGDSLAIREMDNVSAIITTVEESNGFDFAVLPADTIDEFFQYTQTCAIADYIKDYSGRVAVSSYLYRPLIDAINSYKELASKSFFDTLAKEDLKETLSNLFFEITPLSPEEYKFLKETPELKVYLDSSLNPSAFFNRRGRIDGIFSDMLNKFSKITNIRIVYSGKLPSDKLYQQSKSLKNNEVILQYFKILSNERADLASVNGYFFWSSVVLAKDERKSDWANSRSIGVIFASPSYYYLKRNGFTNLVQFENMEELLKALKDGRLDFIVINEAAYYELLISDQYWFTKVEVLPITLEPQMFAYHRGSPIGSLFTKVMNGFVDYQEIIKIWDSKPDKLVSDMIFSYYDNIRMQSLRQFFQVGVIMFLFFLAIVLFIGFRTRKIAMNSLAKTAEAEKESNKAKSRFLSNMSHEIRTPLNAILGLSQIALKEGDPNKALSAIAQINSSGNHLLALINDILDMSKIEADKLEIANVSFCIKDKLKDIKNMFSVKSKEKSLDFVMNIDEKLPDYVRGDSLRVYQILINLLSNAVKFTPPHGKVELVVKVLSDEGDSILILFQVIDSGIGIAEENKGKIFGAFEQGDSSITKLYGGTGLGLAISKKLATLMKGSLTFDSKLGEGTTFDFTIPLGKVSADEEDTLMLEGRTSVKESDLRGMKILVVDDMPINRVIVSKMLESKKVIIEEAENGKQAIEKFESSPVGYYDVILMDAHMPIINGYDATKAIRLLDREDAKTIYIIALSASAFKEDIEEARQSGMNGHIAKPINIDSLLHNLYEAADKIGFKAES